ncbi:hypothetical protein [Streptomyces solincola]|uniref:hypothetical protein n=1 Tax=Streptomyces solincola TaxID=2100817 RepID=UPI0026A16A63|nr:hypothetical protein [Streptomyces solincola]
MDLAGAECADNTDTDSVGTQPVQQGEAKEELAEVGGDAAGGQAGGQAQAQADGELAETGAAETSFLLIGAATMIAGGIGFRMLPRLVAGGRAAA